MNAFDKVKIPIPSNAKVKDLDSLNANTNKTITEIDMERIIEV